jgi:hypothetical protein
MNDQSGIQTHDSGDQEVEDSKRLRSPGHDDWQSNGVF